MSPTRSPVSTGAFDGTTTYGSNYHAHEMPERPHYAPPAPREQVRPWSALYRVLV
jgi:hypothetical protein